MGRQDRAEVGRFVVNGLVATLVNWGVMRFCLDILEMPWVWLAFWIGAVLGIPASFIGNRYFVFRSVAAPVVRQAAKFVATYVTIALVGSAVMAIWSDWLQLDSNIGFFLTTCVQVVLSYIGNKVLVFT